MFRIVALAGAFAALIVGGSLKAAEYSFQTILDTSTAGIFDHYPQLDGSGAAYFDTIVGSDEVTVRAVPGSFDVLAAYPADFQSVNEGGQVVTYTHSENLNNGSLSRILGGVTTDIPMPTSQSFFMLYGPGAFNDIARAWINDNGTVAYAGEVPPDTINVALYSSNHPDDALVATSAAGPIFGASFFDTILPSNPGLNNLGDIAFAGSSADGDGIFTVSQDGDLTTRLLVTEHPEIAVLSSQLVMDDNGTILFTVALQDGTISLFSLDINGNQHQIINTAGPFAEDILISYDINSHGQVVYRTHLDDNKNGIFAGPDPVLDKVIQTGDPLAGSTVTDLSFYRGLNDAGQIAFWASLADGRSGVFRADPVVVPEPTTLVLAAIGGLVVLGFARRRSIRSVAVVILFPLLVAGYVNPSLAAPAQWTDNGHYYEYVPTRLNWAAALADANSRTYLGLPGYLATVTSSAENDLISSLLTDADWGAWLAGSDSAVEGSWHWVAGPEQGLQFWQGNQNGAPVNGAFNGWDFNEPNNTNNEDTVAIWGPNGASGQNSWGRWNDFQGSDTQGYVVEYSAIPEPSTLALAAVGTLALAVTAARRRFA